jgi:hypothetical protein
MYTELGRLNGMLEAYDEQGNILCYMKEEYIELLNGHITKFIDEKKLIEKYLGWFEDDE